MSGTARQILSLGRRMFFVPPPMLRQKGFLCTSPILANPDRPTLNDPVITERTGGGHFITKSELRDFKAILPDLIRELTFEGDHKELPDVNQHLAKCIQYTVSSGKLNRGTAVPTTLKLLFKDEVVSEELKKEARILGWCVEFMQSFFLVADDMMDESVTRRGQECWHLRNNLGNKAINDAILLETCIYTILEKFFRDKPYYLNILDAFLYTTRHTAIGQSLDLMSSSTQEGGSCKLDDFTMKRYTSIVRHKTAYYSFYLPVQLGMVLAGIKDPELYRQARTLLLAMGHLFQVQDDYLDCFGDPSITGKEGTDIQDGKCSWLIVLAMQRANSQQKESLRKSYGSKDPEDVKAVKSVYEELKVKKIFKSYEEDEYNDIVQQINHLSHGREAKALNQDIFHSFLNKIYKRDN